MMSTNMSFVVTFAIFEREKETNYTWVLDNLHGLFVNEVYPSMIVIDIYLALINAVESTFPSSWHFLCI